MTESRRKEFGTKSNVVWAEVVKMESGSISVSFRSESETTEGGEAQSKEQALKAISQMLEQLKLNFAEAKGWSEAMASEMMEGT